ncbi:MAG: carboxypeptidase-like regulatory domain-containing protein, partial [Bacteroidetes bacterium]|nr:carboxypeptidase-like regulatory domain-containing protein [Bacteroidota bacterium]
MKRKHCLGILLLLLMSSPAFAQFTVSGKVTADLTGEELPGVYVLVNNSQQGVVTDLNGNYKIEVPGASGALTFSFVGYNKETFEVNAQTGTLNVVLTEDLGRLEEVVVTGLATTVKRSNLANAVSTISADELVGTTSQPTLDGAIYGKVTGANIVQSSGAPGGGIAIRLRGVSSITGQNQPLFIVDGVYLSNAEIPSGLRNASGANSASEENASNRIADLNPDDIESMEILKGPSAAAIYGTRANAGVVIITTKRGKEGRTQVNLSQDFGVNRAINLLGMRDWTADRVRDSFSEEEAQRFLAAQQAGKIYDYEEEIYGETGPISQTNLSVTGGGEKTKFFLGASVRNEDGIIKNTGFDRNSIRLNIDHKISDRFSISTGSNYVNSKTNRGFTGNENEGGLSYGYNLAFTRPWVDLHPDEFGNYPNNPNSSGNPLFVRDRTINEEGVNRFIQSAQLKANIIRSDRTLLTATLSGGLDFFTNETFIYVPKEHQGQGVQQGFIGQGKNNVRNLN